jgi:hypothetical protein
MAGTQADEMPQVLRRHGWVATGKGTHDESDYTHPDHPGHVVSVHYPSCEWTHWDGTSKKHVARSSGWDRKDWDYFMKRPGNKSLRDAPVVSGPRPIALDTHLAQFHGE